jgi:hypothetical protein
MISRFFRNVSSILCHHEWATRREAERVYLECLHCLATTPGVRYGHSAKPLHEATRAKVLEPARAA